MLNNGWNLNVFNVEIRWYAYDLWTANWSWYKQRPWWNWKQGFIVFGHDILFNAASIRLVGTIIKYRLPSTSAVDFHIAILFFLCLHFVVNLIK